MTRNFDCLLPYEDENTSPPGHTKVDYDVITGPLKMVDANTEHTLYNHLGLSNKYLQRIRQIAFCTRNAVNYLNACHSRVPPLPI